jgi:hypothetical protein
MIRWQIVAWVAPLFVIGGLFWLFARGSRRFVAEQRKAGRWDKYGPLVETEPPPANVRGSGMNERLEVIGKWKGKVLRRRSPNEKP